MSKSSVDYIGRELPESEGSNLWLVTVIKDLTEQLRQNKLDVDLLTIEVKEARNIHVACREQILDGMGGLDKKIEIVMVRLGFYVATVTFCVTILASFLFQHWVK